MVRRQRMKIVVTGGAGFIGSHLVDRLVMEDHDVIVVDHHRRNKLRFPNSNSRVYKMRFGDPELANMFEQESPDAVFHLAAQISVTHSVSNPVYDAQTNVIDALQLLQHAKRTGVEKFIFVSSGGAIYGDQELLPTPELMNAQPISPYGVNKQAFEHYLDAFGQVSDTSASVLRFANVYGPRQQLTGGEGGVIPLFLNKIFSKEEAIIFGDGSSTRDYVYVEDAVDAFMLALQKDLGVPINISTGAETSIQELWDILSDIHIGETKKVHEPDRPGEILRSCLDSSKCREVLGWEPATTLEQGLRQTYDWFKKTYYAAGDNKTN